MHGPAPVTDAQAIGDTLAAFVAGSRFVEAGGVVTDLDGTAVHELEGGIAVPEPVVEGLKALTDHGRPLVLNTLRFPLSVINTFGRAWHDISSKPVPLVSMNGSQIGYLDETKGGAIGFLNHGDLRLKNLLVDEDGQVTALIDWEFCLSAVAPHWDLSLALHDLSVDGKQALLAGYGMDEEAVRAAGRSWVALNILNYAPFFEQAVAQGDEARLESYRTRLSGALDLYSL